MKKFIEISRKAVSLKIIVLIFCMTGQFLGAEENRELTLQLSTLPEAKLQFTQYFTFPFLEGNSPLTEDNNIGLSLRAEITPISVNGLAEAIWTPIAFFQLTAGGRIGSGWPIQLFGGDIYGIGINREDDEGNAEYSG